MKSTFKEQYLLSPYFLDMATDEYVMSKILRKVYRVWHDKDKMFLEDYHNDHMWATISTTHTVSWMHVDDKGFTSTSTLAGGKLWPITDGSGIESIDVFLDWDLSDFVSDYIILELIYLSSSQLQVVSFLPLSSSSSLT